MIRILQSPWVAAVLGCLLYLGITFSLIRPGNFTPPKAPPATIHSASDDPSWKFKNPEINQWVEQMKVEKDAVATREQQLSEWEARLDAERLEITTVTQTVARLQADFDKSIVRMDAQQADNAKRQAKLVAAMSPDGAAAMFNEMPDDDVVRILYNMKADQASAILDTMSKAGKAEARRAAGFTERLHQVLPGSTNTVASATP